MRYKEKTHTAADARPTAWPILRQARSRMMGALPGAAKFIDERPQSEQAGEAHAG
jgi:hypothetical protein